MALSMFLRNPACTSRVFSQQMLRLATQPSVVQRTLTSSKPVQNLALKEAKFTPILNAVCSFQTSAVRRSAGGDHSKLWIIERSVSALLLPLVPLALMMPNKVLDSVLAVAMVAHSFWGLEAIAVDYVRASIFGPVIPKVAIGFVYVISIASLGGLFYLISHDIGIANAIRRIWSIRSGQSESH